tara:strand:+ start:600 stop:1499 length:900 start_codon:yes stop_codon:yes gene_type:complete
MNKLTIGLIILGVITVTLIVVYLLSKQTSVNGITNPSNTLGTEYYIYKEYFEDSIVILQDYQPASVTTWLDEAVVQDVDNVGSKEDIMRVINKLNKLREGRQDFGTLYDDYHTLKTYLQNNVNMNNEFNAQSLILLDLLLNTTNQLHLEDNISVITDENDNKHYRTRFICNNDNSDNNDTSVLCNDDTLKHIDILFKQADIDPGTGARARPDAKITLNRRGTSIKIPKRSLSRKITNYTDLNLTGENVKLLNETITTIQGRISTVYQYVRMTKDQFEEYIKAVIKEIMNLDTRIQITPS